MHVIGGAKRTVGGGKSCAVGVGACAQRAVLARTMASAGTSASKRQESFHGAFTGGFSAGFYNSVGSAEGWTPSTFTSSRDKRAAPREQRPEDFMDDEDGLLTEQLQARPEFDTLGSTAGDVARQHADREAAGGAIPGPAPSELIMPVGDPMGKKLLKTMGWREGQGVGSRVRRKRRRPVQAGGDESEEDLPEQARAGLGRKARELVEKGGLTFAPKNTDLKAQMVVAKTNLHGIGHEPFKDAPEFGASRGLRDSTAVTRGVYSTGALVVRASDADQASLTKVGLSREPPAASVIDRGSRGSHGFVLDDAEDDVYEEGFGKEAYDDALEADGGNTASESSLVKTAKAWASGEGDGEEEPTLASRRYARCPSDGRLPPVGFIVASRPDGMQKHWPPPIPPADFQPVCSFDDSVVNPLRISARGGNGAGLDAPRRAQLLGESRPLPPGDASSVPPVLPQQDSPGLPQGSSALSFLSPSARKKLLDAASGAGAPSGTSSSSRSASTAVARAGGAAAAVERRPGAGLQENANQSKEGVQFSLASKFTSEKPQSVQAEDDPVAPVGGVDPASRPAGLTLRTPTALGASSLRLSPVASEHENRGAEQNRDPERSTLAWTPAPLLCRRLNVPVPKVSSLIDWAAKSGPQAGRGAAAAKAPQQDLLGSLGKFVPEVSAPRQSKVSQVPLLKGMEQRHPPSLVSASRPPALATAAQDNPPPERPPIDLFKSVFESESESESESEDEDDDESEAGRTPAVAGEAGATPTALPTGVSGIDSQSLPGKAPVRRGYGSESSDDESEVIGRPGGKQQSISYRRPEKQDDHGRERGKTRGLKRHRREAASSSRDASSSGEESDRSTRQSKSASRKRSSSKGRHKHKHKHKNEKSEKKHRKHDHKRKKSSSKR